LQLNFGFVKQCLDVLAALGRSEIPCQCKVISPVTLSSKEELRGGTIVLLGECFVQFCNNVVCYFVGINRVTL